MSAASHSETIGTRPSPSLACVAGWLCAAILVWLFVIQALWALTDAGPDFRPLLSPLAAGALTIAWTLGAAVLLLTRVGTLALPLPRWLLRAAPWVLCAFFAVLALAHLHQFATNASGDWRIDLQGPLLLLLAGLCIIVASEPRSS